LHVRQQIVDSLAARGREGTADWDKAVNDRDHWQRFVDAATAELPQLQSQLAELDAEQAAIESERYA
jgi:hypothetical protein